MLITFKQKEIIEALHDYIKSQGINITGKDIKILFTASRKGNGITADISIEDTKISNIDSLSTFKGDPDSNPMMIPPPTSIFS